MASFDYLLKLIRESRTLFVLTNDAMDSKKRLKLTTSSHLFPVIKVTRKPTKQ